MQGRIVLRVAVIDEEPPVMPGRVATRDFVPPSEFDDYVILSELGRGHMGKVYLAEDTLLARQVAIKFIAGVEPDLEARQRFLMEARAGARVQHPNVLGVYRVGELGERLYIVSELVRGKPLAELPRPMPWNEALDIAIELARGLAAAHRRGVVHSDIKTANAMITEDNVAKLVDFGLARVVHEGDDDAQGSMIGTPDYMAPEVWAGRAPTRRSDVYSFGAMLYELVAGKVPFAEVPAFELAKFVAEQPAPALENVDARFAKLVARCLERDPEARFASGEELREALEQLHPSRAVAVKSDENPYRGLRPFEATHRGLFFGRGLEIGEMVERLRTDAITIVTGDSGVGKSSLCRAGVVPAILDGAIGNTRTWEAITMIPGRRPLAALAHAFGDPTLAARVLQDPEELPRELMRRAGKDKGVVLFVDQMEELVTVADPAETAALDAGLARLSEGAPGIRIITTVRADFLSKIAALPRIGRELSRLLYFVSPLPPERIRDVVTGPAHATGVEFETPELIQALVDATAEAGSGGLPLLSFALAELWERRENRDNKKLITQAALDRMGGVSGSLARHGDAVIAGMSSTERANIRRVLLRLVTSVGTRARRTEAELDVSAGTKQALDALVKGRLLVVHHGDDGTTYEVAHEVLVHGWGTLREWLDSDAEDRARRERLAAAAAEWEKNRRRADLTYRGPRLVEARMLDDTNLTALERAFIAASIRVSTRRKWLVRITAIGVVVAIVGVYAVQRYLAAKHLAEQIAVEVTAGKQSLAAAHIADAAQHELALQAYALFDAGKHTEGERLWKQVREKRETADAAFRAAEGRIETALAKDPSRHDVRDILGDILLERAALAESMFLIERRDDLIARLASHDESGKRRAQWSKPSRVIVHAPAGTEIKLGDKQLGVGEANVELAPGAYMLDAGGARAALLVERGKRSELTIEPPRTVPDGFIYIPAGTFLFGSSAADESVRMEFFGTVPLHARTIGAFAIARDEVTIADWLAYAEANPKAPLPNIPAQAAGLLVIDRADDGKWRIAMQPQSQRYTAKWGDPIEYTGRKLLAKQDWRRFPVTGVTAREFSEYAAWLAQTGKVPGARLCSEPEWVHAARGADGRSFPNGDHVDFSEANLDRTHSQELMGPDEIASHPESESPFGLHDVTGNAFEFTLGEIPGEYVAKGGSYYHDRKTANIANRYVLPGSAKDPSLGLRLCADVR
jgi:formylglycine-generating enzyme required for sulfatase activity